MKIPKLELDQNSIKQFLKIREELLEVKEAILFEGKEKTLEECTDVIVATFNLMFILESRKMKLKEALEKVNEKIEKRDSRGEIKIEKWVNL